MFEFIRSDETFIAIIVKTFKLIQKIKNKSYTNCKRESASHCIALNA